MVQLYPEKMSFHIGLAADGLYTMNDNLEGMKYSIGGSGYRLLPIFRLRDAMGMCYTFHRPNYCVMKHGGRKIQTVSAPRQGGE